MPSSLTVPTVDCTCIPSLVMEDMVSDEGGERQTLGNRRYNHPHVATDGLGSYDKGCRLEAMVPILNPTAKG